MADSLLRWFDHHGRKHLPWQQDPTPYRVWVSEIMLQQTQVSTVMPYYQAFMRRFPDIFALAAAPIDEVLHQWSGLGYYARGRNLHRAARMLVERFGGEFPRTLAEVEALPGVGRSTAGAVLALSRGERHPILDGNVKRVLARYFGIEGFPGEPSVHADLWRRAEECTPHTRVAEYTQAIMDLGATVCVRRRPLCLACPLATGCAARAAGQQEFLPTPRPRRVRPARRTCMLVAIRAGQFVLLERRPSPGIWGGLWGLPEFATADAAVEWSRRELHTMAESRAALAPLHHAFTHFDLQIDPIRIECQADHRVMEPERYVWYNAAAPQALGLPAPVKSLIESLFAERLT
ncbi:MAG TPA: A/G-specific adenine glycosylase [Steroidobacteraceae bacterium]